MEIKKFFFDRKAVTSRTDSAKRNVLSKIGAFIRTTAQRSMRRRKSASKPGSPPSAHKGLLKKFLYFGYDPSSDSVVVGPVRLGKGEAPPLNEYGGMARRTKVVGSGRKAFSPRQAKSFAAKIRTGQIVGRKQAPRKAYQAKYPGRPFMGPALEKEKPNIPSQWANSVRR